jgi:hypothetical protein
LAVNFLSPRNVTRVPRFERALAFSVPTRARIFCVTAFEFLCVGGFFAQGRKPASEQRHRLEIAVTIAAADV